jgi:hypothetical protein
MIRNRKRLFRTILVIGLSGSLLAAMWRNQINRNAEPGPLLANSTQYGFAGVIGNYQWRASDRLLKEAVSSRANTFTEVNLKNNMSKTLRVPLLFAFRLPLLPVVSAVSPSGEWLCLESKSFKTTHNVALVNFRTGATLLRAGKGLFAGWLPDSSGWVSFQFTNRSIILTVQFQGVDRSPTTVTYPLRQQKTFRWPIGITTANEVVVADWELGRSSSVDISLLPLFGAQTMHSVTIPIPKDRSVCEVAFSPLQSRLALHMQEVFVPLLRPYSPRTEDIWVSDLTGRAPRRLGSVKVELDDSTGSDLSGLKWNWTGTQVAYTFAGRLYLKDAGFAPQTGQQ